MTEILDAMTTNWQLPPPVLTGKTPAAATGWSRLLAFC